MPMVARDPLNEAQAGSDTQAESARRRMAMQGLARPPRRLGPSLILQTLFGGMLQQMGWLFAGFGMVFVWAFVGQAEIAWKLRAGTTAEIEARVTGSVDTGASVNETPVRGTRYVFEMAGRQFENVSYATGHALAEGATATVEYSTGDPQMSRIKGMRSAMFGPAVLFVLIFPGIGLAFVLGSLRGRMRELHLLRHGIAGFAKLVDKSPTNTRINNQTVYRLRFEFRTRDGRTGHVEASSHQPEALEDEAEEAILYDPQAPERATVLDGLPGHAGIGGDGQLHGGARAALARLVLPLATLGGHGWWAWLKFFA
jgi:hypothetical protein